MKLSIQVRWGPESRVSYNFFDHLSRYDVRTGRGPFGTKYPKIIIKLTIFLESVDTPHANFAVSDFAASVATLPGSRRSYRMRGMRSKVGLSSGEPDARRSGHSTAGLNYVYVYEPWSLGCVNSRSSGQRESGGGIYANLGTTPLSSPVENPFLFNQCFG